VYSFRITPQKKIDMNPLKYKESDTANNVKPTNTTNNGSIDGVKLENLVMNNPRYPITAPTRTLPNNTMKNLPTARPTKVLLNSY
jgi:hypothetical protein